MSVTDPIADMLTKIRNASRAKLERVDFLGSHFKAAIADVLKREGFIRSYKWVEADPKQRGAVRQLRVYLKYTGKGKREPVITDLIRASKAGRRKYVGTQQIPKVLGGMGVAILSTPQGVMADVAARKAGVGGELICYVA